MPDQDTRRCIGSARFGIEPHDAPINEFPAQPSQKDGLGRMCTTHWRAYTAGLAREAKARKAAAEPPVETSPAAPAETPTKRRRAKAEAEDTQPA
jgi:hypothetical protein